MNDALDILKKINEACVEVVCFRKTGQLGFDSFHGLKFKKYPFFAVCEHALRIGQATF